MPRQTDLNTQIQSRICEALRKGHYVKEACALAGISVASFYTWKKRGDAGEEPFAAFTEAVEEAEAEAIEYLLTTIHDAAGDDWKAALAILERRNKAWARQEKVELSGDENQPVKIKLVWLDDLGRETPKETVQDEDSST